MMAESFTWAATALLGGVSTGIAAGGAIVESHAPVWAMLAYAVLAFVVGFVLAPMGMRLW